MCECLEYEDGEMHLCVVCADEWRSFQESQRKPAPPADAATEAVREAAKEVAPQLEGFCVQAETEARPPGGQQAGLDKSWASRVPPSVLTEPRWYVREFRCLLIALDREVGK